MKLDSITASVVSIQGYGLLDSLMKDLKHYKAVIGSLNARIEIDKYFGEEFDDDTKEFNILLWWKHQVARFPIQG